MKIQTIVKGNKMIQKLLAINTLGNTQYRWSRYLIFRDESEGVLLYNSITGEMLLLSEVDKKHLFDLSLAVEDKNYLLHLGYLVPISCDEQLRVEQIRKILLKRREAEGIITRYIILPTTYCNAHCFYCYQSEIKHVTMSLETANMVTEFIAAHHGNKKVLLSWYGGEPTLGKHIIDYICERMGDLGINYLSEMVSNAYLFDEELIEHAKNAWKLHNIQITLDGTEHVYNMTKAYKNIKDNAFQRVLRNIDLFIQANIQVNIRLNVDNHNADDLLLLINNLTEHFKNIKGIAIYARRLDEDTGFSPIIHTENDKKRLLEKYQAIQNKLEENGWSQIWRFSLPNLIPTSCMADDPCTIQITPDGIIGKCEDCIYEHTVGTLTEGITNIEEVKKWQKRELRFSCADCVLFPSCVHLLQNCPTRLQDCPTDEKDHRMKLCYEFMLKAYNAWKTNHMAGERN